MAPEKRRGPLRRTERRPRWRPREKTWGPPGQIRALSGPVLRQTARDRKSLPRSTSHGGLAGPEEAFLGHFLGNRRRELGDEAFDLRRVEGPADSRPDELVLFERVDQGLDLHDLVCPQVGGRIDRPPSPSPVPAPEMVVVGTGPDAGLVCELRLASDDAHDDRAGE